MRPRAVLFDSGHTLVRPLGGRWFPYPGFFERCARHGLAVEDDARLAEALDAQWAWLAEHHLVPDLASQVAQFREYHRRVLARLGVEPPAEALDALAEECVHRIGFEPYPDTRPGLEALHARGVPMGVITDAWPSAELHYRHLGLRELFGPFVISSVHGIVKPAPALFDAALAGLGEPPERVLLVDDGPAIVRAARDHGMQAVLMARPDVRAPADVRGLDVVRDVDEVARRLL